jgi:hypothetical protein
VRHSPNELGIPSPGNKEVKTPSPNPRQAHRNVEGYSRMGKWDIKAFQEAMFISV